MSDEIGDLRWLAGWYAAQTDGIWEHDHGVKIDTLDNPGWDLRIDVTDTELQTASLPLEEHENAGRWMRVWKNREERVFNAVGDATALPAMISRFRRWVAENSSPETR
jgi:hypothetical protein